MLMTLTAAVLLQTSPGQIASVEQANEAAQRRAGWQSYVDHAERNDESILICNCSRGFGASRHVIDIDDVGIDVEIAVYEDTTDDRRGLSVDYACDGAPSQTASGLITLEPDEYLIASRLRQMQGSESFAQNNFSLHIHTWRYPYDQGEWADPELSESGNWYQREFVVGFGDCEPGDILAERRAGEGRQ